LHKDLLSMSTYGGLTAVVDLEDSVPDRALDEAVDHVVGVLSAMADADEPLPLVFVRPREVGQLEHLLDRLGEQASAVTGVVVPKYEPGNAERWWALAEAAAQGRGGSFWVMPVVEHRSLVLPQTRADAMAVLADDLDTHRQALSVRFGGTDISGALGLRRDRRTTIHDIRPVAEIISLLVSTLAASPDHWVVSGPVWEYLSGADEMLAQEIVRDLANGMLGKSVIHPVHVPVVHAHLAVPWDDYTDAREILDNPGGGAFRSSSGDRMSECGPHSEWARRTVVRGDLFGVLRPGTSPQALVAATMQKRSR
jgi:citrate lyase beta subunit